MALIFEILFYKVIIYLIFLAAGRISFSVWEFIEVLMPVEEIGRNFTGTFICFYLCIPFLNVLIHNLNEKQHVRLLLLCSFIYVFFGTIKVLPVNMNYVSWFVVLYFIASYIRLYPKDIFAKTKFWGMMTMISLGVSALSVVACTWLGTIIGRNSPYAFVADSNTFLAVLNAVSAFMFFKNLKIKQSKVINTISSTTFGVLLIHANSSPMRSWLWNDICNVTGAYASSWLPFLAIVSIIGVFIACMAIDLIRQSVVEKPFLRFLDVRLPRITKKWSSLESIFYKENNPVDAD